MADRVTVRPSPRDESHSSRPVSAEQPHGLTVRIATPGTVDALCRTGIHRDARAVNVTRAFPLAA